jgi:hypothetical protein
VAELENIHTFSHNMGILEAKLYDYKKFFERALNEQLMIDGKKCFVFDKLLSDTRQHHIKFGVAVIMALVLVVGKIMKIWTDIDKTDCIDLSVLSFGLLVGIVDYILSTYGHMLEQHKCLWRVAFVLGYVPALVDDDIYATSVSDVWHIINNRGVPPTNMTKRVNNPEALRYLDYITG